MLMLNNIIYSLRVHPDIKIYGVNVSSYMAIMSTEMKYILASSSHQQYLYNHYPNGNVW